MFKKYDFQKGLLDWINQKKDGVKIYFRPFLWRNSKIPYKILVSEILLQK